MQYFEIEYFITNYFNIILVFVNKKPYVYNI